MRIAVIKTGGKQYIVSEGLKLTIEKVTGVKEGDTVVFDQVLMTDDGSQTEVGTPMISGAKVSAKVLEEGRDDKKIVVKYKQKSRYFKKRGHRQPNLRVEIQKI